MSQVTDVIVGALSPHLGPLMARSAVDAHRKKLGLGETLTAPNVESLLEKLRLGLVVFVGPEKAERVLLEVRQALARPDSRVDLDATASRIASPLATRAPKVTP